MPAPWPSTLNPSVQRNQKENNHIPTSSIRRKALGKFRREWSASGVVASLRVAVRCLLSLIHSPAFAMLSESTQARWRRQSKPARQEQIGRVRRSSTRSTMRALVKVTAASLAAYPAMISAGEDLMSHHHQLNPYTSNMCTDSSRDLQQLVVSRRRRRGRRKNTEALDTSCAHTNLPIDLAGVMNNCRGGDIEMSSIPSTHHAGTIHESCPSETESRYPSTILVNAFDKTRSMDKSSQVINASRNVKQNQTGMLESTATEEAQLQRRDREQSFSPRPRLVIEFDTQAIGGVEQGTGIRQRIRSRIRADNEWDRRLSNRGPALSISLDAFSSPLMIQQNTDENFSTVVPPQYLAGSARDNSNNGHTLLENIFIPTRTALILITQTASLLPSLIIARRGLNSTWIAIVDYVRGRTFRNAFTKLERAYLRYYEFPAVTRTTARLVSQIGILLGLSWAVRWWMIWVLMGEVGPMVMGVTGIDVGMVGTSGGKEGVAGSGWKVVGLPCHRRGKGMAWLCGFFWIGSVVGIGHACAMALSVWGGPLRVQAAAQQTENPKHVLRRIIHHPIIWIRELEEWKHLKSLAQPKRSGKDQNNGVPSFNPDPILFPSTWLPLRWLQIFAVAKAFSTDPLKYRWCSPDNDKVVIPRLMKQYLVQLALGDEWHRVFLGEKRVGLGIAVIFSYFIALLYMVFTAFTLDGGAAAMLIPSVLAAMLSGFMNIMIFWNRLGNKEQKKALNAMGFA